MHGFYDSSNCDIASYSNDNTSSASSSNCNLEAVIDSLEESTDNLFQWFINNYMKAIADKCRLLVTGD